MIKSEYRALLRLLSEAEDISLAQCKEDYTEGNRGPCYHGVQKMTFRTATLARGKKSLAGELRMMKVRLVIR